MLLQVESAGCLSAVVANLSAKADWWNLTDSKISSPTTKPRRMRGMMLRLVDA